jgi:hypothetical protein
MKFLALTLLALAGLPAPSTASQEKITLAQVLARAAEYVDEFQRQLSSIVAEETYLQEVAPAAGSTVGPNRRALRSDLLLLRPNVHSPGFNTAMCSKSTVAPWSIGANGSRRSHSTRRR